MKVQEVQKAISWVWGLAIFSIVNSSCRRFSDAPAACCRSRHSGQASRPAGRPRGTHRSASASSSSSSSPMISAERRDGGSLYVLGAGSS